MEAAPFRPLFAAIGQGLRTSWARSDFRAQTLPAKTPPQRPTRHKQWARSVASKQTLPKTVNNLAQKCRRPCPRQSKTLPKTKQTLHIAQKCRRPCPISLHILTRKDRNTASSFAQKSCHLPSFSHLSLCPGRRLSAPAPNQRPGPAGRWLSSRFDRHRGAAAVSGPAKWPKAPY